MNFRRHFAEKSRSFKDVKLLNAIRERDFLQSTKVDVDGVERPSKYSVNVPVLRVIVRIVVVLRNKYYPANIWRRAFRL